MKPINVGILTCLNERPEVSRILFNCAERLGLHVIAGVTHQDDVDICIEYAQDYIVEDNVAGKKWNAALQFALTFDHTHLLIMGDDDAISTEGLMMLMDAAEAGHEYVGFKRNAFVELRTQKALVSEYKFKCDKLIGAGRLISVNAIRKCSYAQTVKMARDHGTYFKGDHHTFTPEVAQYLIGYHYAKPELEPRYVGLWPENAPSGLDHFSEMRLVMAGYPPTAMETLHPNDNRVHITDFKSERNIWPFSILEEKNRVMDAEVAMWFLNYEERSHINLMKKDRRKHNGE